jgi:hypothetical protein
MTVAPLLQPTVDVVLVGVDQAPLGDRLLDQGADRDLSDVLQHPDHDLDASLHHPEDRRVLLGQRPPTSLLLQAPSMAGSSFFFRVGMTLMSSHDIDFVTFELAGEGGGGTAVDDPLPQLLDHRPGVILVDVEFLGDLQS